MNQIDWIAESLDEVNRLGKCLATVIRSHLSEHRSLVVGLNGLLGAGKTTLISAICQHLGVPKVQVSSPTFSLQNVYRFELADESIPILHFDFYRIADEDELVETGFDEEISKRVVALIEWSNRFPESIPAESLFVEISHHSESTRKIEFRTPRDDLMEALRNQLNSNVQ